MVSEHVHYTTYAFFAMTEDKLRASFNVKIFFLEAEARF